MECTICKSRNGILVVHPDGTAYCLSDLQDEAKANMGDIIKVSGLIGDWLEALGHKVTPEMFATGRKPPK